MQSNTILRSYKMTSDRGFAPNPYAGILTLAICKPYIRKHCAVEGQWLAGFTSKRLTSRRIVKVGIIYPAHHYRRIHISGAICFAECITLILRPSSSPGTAAR
jgi:hypothetical protein